MNEQRGFTLVEFLVTLAVVVTLLTIAVPSYRSLIQNNRIVTQTNEFITAHKLARIEAVKRRSSVTVCASADQTDCDNNNNWQAGWIVFVDDQPGDNASDADGDLDAGEELLRVWGPLTGGATLTETGGADSVRYRPTGLTAAGAALSFQLRIPDCRGNLQRDIGITVTGSTNVTRVACP